MSWKEKKRGKISAVSAAHYIFSANSKENEILNRIPNSFSLALVFSPILFLSLSLPPLPFLKLSNWTTWEKVLLLLLLPYCFSSS
jgi:hypothetical protein